ncbi:hypothetical protein TNCV_3055471 [Trichonephila clavipes]|nr:hypothetical protein TNCV_3055471 [Trichonephila clavipes]
MYVISIVAQSPHVRVMLKFIELRASSGTILVPGRLSKIARSFTDSPSNASKCNVKKIEPNQIRSSLRTIDERPRDFKQR